MLYNVFRAAFWVLTHLVCRYHVSGREHMPLTGPVLVVANHLSWYDPILLWAVLPRRVWFFTKIEIFRWPVVGLLCRLTGQIPVNRGESDRAALESGLRYLQEGKALMVFPEGTVERQEQMISAHTGTAMLAMRTGATILPIAHCGTRHILRSLRIWFPRVEIQIGKPYTPVLPEGVSRKVALKLVTEDMMTRIAEMLPKNQRGVYREKVDGSESLTFLP
jgi:1-acyl-sn-glycerol-3-phosphate acyltransferase